MPESRHTVVRLNAFPTREQFRAFHDTLELSGGEALVTLEIPERVELRTPFDYGAAIQAILTWGMRSKTTNLVVGSVDDFDLEALRSSDVHLVASLLADQIFTKDGSDVTDEIAESADAVVSERNTLDALRLTNDGRASILLPDFIPRLSNSPELHVRAGATWDISEAARTLYQDVWPERGRPSSLRDAISQEGEVRLGTESTERVSRTTWPRTHPFHQSSEPFYTLPKRTLVPEGRVRESLVAGRVQAKPIEDELGEALFELVQNTEWHAVPWPGGSTGRSLRALSFARVPMSRTDIASLRDVDHAAADYADDVYQELDPTGERGQVVFGALSIIDSGVGLARSAASGLGRLDEVDENEIYFLIAALSKTIRVSRRLMGDIGLPRVQQLLTNLKGFMRIRTGRTEIRRNFIRLPFEPLDPLTTKPARSNQFIDWVPLEPSEFSVGDRVGTDITILVPLDFQESAK